MGTPSEAGYTRPESQSVDAPTVRKERGCRGKGWEGAEWSLEEGDRGRHGRRWAEGQQAGADSGLRPSGLITTDALAALVSPVQRHRWARHHGTRLGPENEATWTPFLQTHFLG